MPSESAPKSSSSSAGASEVEVEAGQGGDGGDDEEKESVRRSISFIGERIWDTWARWMNFQGKGGFNLLPLISIYLLVLLFIYL